MTEDVAYEAPLTKEERLTFRRDRRAGRRVRDVLAWCSSQAKKLRQLVRARTIAAKRRKT